MPTYTYKREDGSVFEIEQRITEPALKTCPTTGQPVKRLITSGAGLVFKGSGFYLTDYAKTSSPGPARAEGSRSDRDASDKGGSGESASAAGGADTSASEKTGPSDKGGSGESSTPGKSS